MRGASFFPARLTADEGVFIQALLEERVLAVPGRGFGCPGYVRFAFCVDTKVIEGRAGRQKRGCETRIIRRSGSGEVLA